MSEQKGGFFAKGGEAISGKFECVYLVGVSYLTNQHDQTIFRYGPLMSASTKSEHTNNRPGDTSLTQFINI
jgi:hypothetical protein